MIVLGSLYGDEGKGLTTSFLCSKVKNPIVVRFSGGHQAGHTVVYKNKRHVFSNLGSGTLQGIPTYWSKYCTFYPTAFLNEYVLLHKYNPIFYIHPLCPVTTPYDIQHTKIDLAYKNNGTCGVGFGATIKRHEAYYKLYAQDLFNTNVLIAKLQNIAKFYDSTLNIDNFIEDCIEVRNKILLEDSDIINNFIPVFEGSQGILLDKDYGFFPNVTNSNTTSKNALELYPCKEVYYVVRTYQTRHGNGYLSNEDKSVILYNNELETNKYNIHQGNFRIAQLDIPMLKYAIKCDMHYSKYLKKNIVITCMDQLSIDIDKLLSELEINFDNVYLSYGNSLESIIQYKGSI